MKKTKNWGIVFSQKVYERLLAIYPKAHRKEYGSAMAQLFRDQSRDAWNAGRMWGLLRFWFRVLPDLAKTSALEHFANLKGEQNMFQTIIGITRFRYAPLVTFTTVFVGLFGMTMLVTLCLSKSYVSTARLTLSDGSSPITVYTREMQTVFEIIQSQVILGKVIENLNLNVEWGKKYAGGKTLKTDETMKLLKNRITIKPVRNTDLVEVTAYSEDNNEAARIANEIATTYQSFTASQHFKAEHPGTQAEIVDQAKPARHEIRPNVPLNLMIGISVGFLLGGMMALITFLLGRRFRLGEISKSATARQPNTAERIVGIIWFAVGGFLCAWCLILPLIIFVEQPNFYQTSDLPILLLFGNFFGILAVVGLLLYRGKWWAKIPLGTVSAILGVAIIAWVCHSGIGIAGMFMFNITMLIMDALLLFSLVAALILLWPNRAKTEVAFSNQ